MCEIRSVNHRYLEASVRLPEELRSLEHLMRERLNKRLGRGKVDCTLRFTASVGSSAAVRVNRRLAQQIIDAADEVCHLLHESVPPKAMDIMRWPGVLEAEEVDLAPVHKQGD